MPDMTSYALHGRVVTMDAGFTVLESGTVYVKDGALVDVKPHDAPPPAGLESATRIDTAGTIYPGLIELHNHMSYNALPLWNVPATYTNRDQWAALPDYHRLVTAPMTVLSRHPDRDYLRSVVRFAECRCLLGGVTTSQGIKLASNAGIVRYYHGVIRTVEAPGDLHAPAAATHISDVASQDAQQFFAQLQQPHCTLLHLSEGTDAAAHAHFEALHLAGDDWALTKNLGGIHCVALRAADFNVLQAQGAAMIWSPLSNLLLYGQTADIRAAKASGVRIGIGSDWSPSGSKNLLGELKVARLVSDQLGGVFTDRELVAMATRNGADIVEWSSLVGSLEAGKRADLLVVDGTDGDAYTHLITARESDISLVTVDGVARYGSPALMQHFGPGTESWQLGSVERVLNLGKDVPDAVVGNLSLRDACDKLKYGLEHLPELAKAIEQPSAEFVRSLLSGAGDEWFLVLDADEPQGIALRPHLPFGEEQVPTATLSTDAQRAVAAAASAPLSEQVVPLHP